jgi:ribonuclease HI
VRDANGDLDDLIHQQPENLSRDELVTLVRALQRELSMVARSHVVPSEPRQTQPVKPVATSDFTIAFDGGSLGNPGKGYGSYEIANSSGRVAGQRIQFGDNLTNNQAEFMTLIAALKDLLHRIGSEAGSVSLAVRGDSQLVIRGLNGDWKIKHPNLQPLHQEGRALLGRFRSVDLAWQPRLESVRTFGH